MIIDSFGRKAAIELLINVGLSKERLKVLQFFRDLTPEGNIQKLVSCLGGSGSGYLQIYLISEQPSKLRATTPRREG